MTMSRPPVNDAPVDELFLPEPAPRPIKYTLISVDDHLVEPPHMFEGRLPASFQARAPRVIETDEGHQAWQFEDRRYTQVGINAVAGRKPDRAGRTEPFRFDHMRRGCWDIHARIRDMDINGVWASLNFPSLITGFAGRVFSFAKDRELGLHTVRAWNDWLFEEWYSPYPDRIIPCGITFLTDPLLAAQEIRRNAERGFTSVTLPEKPHWARLPSLFSGYWDSVIEACVETGTVISLHVGSSGGYQAPEDAPGLELAATMFGQLSLGACAEWLWSRYPSKYPDLKIALSEGGIGWVAMLIDRLDNLVDRSGYAADYFDERPADILRRNFWFCTIDDPSTIDTRHCIGVENIMLEVDYPHGDSTWPNTQSVIEQVWGHLPEDELRLICCENAAALYRHPLPPAVLPC